MSTERRIPPAGDVVECDEVGEPWRTAPPQPFRVEVHPDRDRVRIVPAGELDLDTAPLVDDALRELAEAGFGDLVLDLSRLSFIDCTGLRVLVTAGARAERTGARLDVVRAEGQVRRLLALSGIDRRLQRPQTGAAPRDHER